MRKQGIAVVLLVAATFDPNHGFQHIAAARLLEQDVTGA
jgi:hypothetical protein